MIEQYVFNKIVADSTLQTLLDDGASGYNLFPTAVPRSLVFNKAVTFSTIITNDVFPNANSVTIQFNVFAKTHTDTVSICNALANLFNGDNNRVDGDINVIYSQRRSEADLSFDFDEGIYHREASYYFKTRSL